MVPTERTLATQLRRGVLEYCVLAVLAAQESYGMEIASTLDRYPTLFDHEGTLYPLLSRLRKQGWVSSRWVESASGPPRRYYRLTDDGRLALATFTDTWGRMGSEVTHILEGIPS
jgi:PadR family transcriptional regulator PadR